MIFVILHRAFCVNISGCIQLGVNGSVCPTGRSFGAVNYLIMTHLVRRFRRSKPLPVGLSISVLVLGSIASNC